jgi:hypothetical protein
MTAPVRLRLSRVRDFDLQAASRALNGLPAFNVARPGPLGNPFVVGQDGDRAECVRLFEVLLGGYIALTTKASVDAQRAVRSYVVDNLKTLRQHNIACWCPLDARCHGDVLLRVFNRRHAA